MNKQEYNTYTLLYLKSLKTSGKSEKTLEMYNRVLDMFNATLDNEKQDIDAINILNFQNSLADNGIKQNSIRHYLICLHAFFEWCERNNMLDKNIVNKHIIPKKEQLHYDLLTLDEITALLNYKPKTKTFHSKRNLAIIQTLILTGCRNSELRAITLGDLDITNNTIRIKKGKGNKEREIPFPAKLQEIIKDYVCDKQYPKDTTEDTVLFGYYNEQKQWCELGIVALTHLVYNYVEKVTGHKKIGSHDLRHAFASYTSNLGADTRTISLCLGHASEQITNDIYISILDKKKAANNMNALLNKM